LNFLDIRQTPKYHILWYPSCKSRVVPCAETGMTKLKVAFS